MSERRAKQTVFVLVIVAALVIALDQYTKYWVRAHIPEYTSWNPIKWLDPIVTLTHVQNSGAAFGMFQGLGPVFMVVALVVILVITVYFRKMAETSWLLRVAFGLQIGGATGNLIDRLLHNWHVTDFIDLRWFPVFNVADSAVVVGTILLGIYTLFMDEAEKQPDVAKEALPSKGAPGPVNE